MTIPCIIIRP
jgi:hypothetical protein